MRPSGLSLSFGTIRSLFGPGSPEDQAAGLADDLQPAKAQKYPWMTLNDQWNDAQWVKRENARFHNGAFDTGEQAIKGDPLFPAQLKPALHNVENVLGADAGLPGFPRQSYTRVSAPGIEKAPLSREVVTTGLQRPGLSAAELTAKIGAPAVAALQQVQGDAADITLATLDKAAASSLFAQSFPTAVAQARTLYALPPTTTATGPATMSEQVFNQGGVKVTATMTQTAIPASLNKWPFAARAVEWSVEAPPGSIVVVDPMRYNLDPHAIAGTYWDSQVVANRVDASGKTTVVPGTIRVLDASTQKVLAAVELPDLSRTLKYPQR